MKIRDYHYRDIEDKFVELKDAENFLAKMGIHDISKNIIGFLYIDDKKGIMLRVLGEKHDRENKKYIEEKIKLANYDLIEDLDIDILNGIEHIKEEEAKNHLIFDENNKTVYKVRNRKEVDNLRSRVFPDDLNIVVPYKEGYVEKIWARSFDYIKKEDIYILSLLKDSVYDEKLKKDSLVACKYFNDGKSEALIFLGITEIL